MCNDVFRQMNALYFKVFSETVGACVSIPTKIQSDVRTLISKYVTNLNRTSIPLQNPCNSETIASDYIKGTLPLRKDIMTGNSRELLVDRNYLNFVVIDWIKLEHMRTSIQ